MGWVRGDERGGERRDAPSSLEEALGSGRRPSRQSHKLLLCSLLLSLLPSILPPNPLSLSLPLSQTQMTSSQSVVPALKNTTKTSGLRTRERERGQKMGQLKNRGGVGIEPMRGQPGKTLKSTFITAIGLAMPPQWTIKRRWNLERGAAYVIKQGAQPL